MKETNGQGVCSEIRRSMAKSTYPTPSIRAKSHLLFEIVDVGITRCGDNEKRDQYIDR